MEKEHRIGKQLSGAPVGLLMPLPPHVSVPDADTVRNTTQDDVPVEAGSSPGFKTWKLRGACGRRGHEKERKNNGAGGGERERE